MFSTKVKIWHNFFLFFLLREWDMINMICKMILSVVTSIGLFLTIMQLRQFWDWFLAPLWNEWVDKFSQKKKEKGFMTKSCGKWLLILSQYVKHAPILCHNQFQETSNTWENYIWILKVTKWVSQIWNINSIILYLWGELSNFHLRVWQGILVVFCDTLGTGNTSSMQNKETADCSWTQNTDIKNQLCVYQFMVCARPWKSKLAQHSVWFYYIITEGDAKGFYSVPMVLSHTHTLTHIHKHNYQNYTHIYRERERECESEK